MKKIIYSLFSLLALNTFAQAPKQYSFRDLIKAPNQGISQVPQEKQMGVTLWSDDFSFDSTWVIDNNGQTALGYGWNINNTSDGWWSNAGINSTSGGKYAELVNGDPTASPATQVLDVIYTLTTAQPIDIATLGGTNQVSLQFQQFGARFNDLQEVQISTDGVTFTTVGTNADMPVLSSAGGSAYSNPNNKTINLANFLPATPSPIWIRFSWTTAYPNSATNPNVWITYGWYIDDVKIVSNPGNDLQVTTTTWGTAGLNYYQIPIAQVAPIDFEANVFNGGQNMQYNAALNVNINSGLFTATSNSANVPALDTVLLTTSSSFTPPANTASYTVIRTITADSTDDVPSNNVMPNINFSVTNFIYARDNNAASGNTSNGTNGFEAGNLFDIYTDATLKAINVRLAGGSGGTTVGTEIFARIYSIDPVTGDFVFEAESDPFIVASNNLNTNLVLPLQIPTTLLANNTYLATVGSYTGGLKISNAGTSDPQTSFFYDGTDLVSGSAGTLYYQTSTPYVRLNFDPTVGLNDESTEINKVSLYPNPVNDVTTLNFNLVNNSNVDILVQDVSGKIISSKSLTNLNAGNNSTNINCTDLTDGIYYITMISNGNTLTKKFVKK